MSWIVDQIKIQRVEINKDFSTYFNVLENIEVISRKTDIWFTDKDRLTIKMRRGTSKYWSNTLTWWTWSGQLFFYTDFFRNRYAIRSYNNKAYWLKSNVWTDLGVSFWTNTLYYNTMKLPMMINGTIPTEYTTTIDGSTAEKVPIAVWDATTNPIWKVLIITDDTNWNQSYRWTFAVIMDNSWWEYTLNWAWIITALKSWAKYQIYDTIWEHLQICTWTADEHYFIWLWTSIVENTKFTWLATKSLQTIKAFSSTQYLQKQISFNNYIWTFNKWTLYASAWALNNPFFYNFVSANTLPVTWDINDIFVFKWRIIISWSNFIWVFNKDFTYESVTSAYWMKSNSICDLWVDAYCISSDKHLISLSETLKWTISATDIWEQMANYLVNFNTNICSWFDWNRFYLYWQYDSTTAWNIIVLDINYKFWSVYTWLRPSSIVSENWITYLTDNNTETVRYFDSSVSTDTSTVIVPRILTNEFDLWDCFSSKILPDIFLWFDNYNQELYFRIYWASPTNNSKILEKIIDITWVSIPTNTQTLWTSNLWTWILWWNAFTNSISYPFMKRIQLKNDSANLWKFELEWKDWNWFYLNRFDILIWFYWDQKNYFSPVNSI